MEIVGYVAYAGLVVMAIVWTMSIRSDLGAEAHEILRAVYFVSSAVIIVAFGVNMAHSLWVVPGGCLFARFIAPILVKKPVVSIPFVLLSRVFARIVRIGVPRHKLQEAQSAAMHAGVDE